MKRLKNLLFLPIFIAGTVSSAEITLDRIAIIVGDGVVLESQVNKMLNRCSSNMLEPTSISTCTKIKCRVKGTPSH